MPPDTYTIKLKPIDCVRLVKSMQLRINKEQEYLEYLKNLAPNSSTEGLIDFAEICIDEMQNLLVNLQNTFSWMD